MEFMGCTFLVRREFTVETTKEKAMTINGNFEAIREALKSHPNPPSTLLMGDVKAIEEAITALVAAAIQGRACAAQLELEFQKQGNHFFARAVANSLDTINKGLATVETKPLLRKVA